MREYLKSMREKLGLSQAEIACELRISQNYYSMIETGERQKKLSMDMAQKLAQVFGVSLEYICEQENGLRG